MSAPCNVWTSGRSATRFLPEQTTEENISSREFLKRAEFILVDNLMPKEKEDAENGGSTDNNSGGGSGSNTGGNGGGDDDNPADTGD